MWFVGFIAAIIAILSLIFGLSFLAQFVRDRTGEPGAKRRMVRNIQSALERGDWKATYRFKDPDVTLIHHLDFAIPSTGLALRVEGGGGLTVTQGGTSIAISAEIGKKLVQALSDRFVFAPETGAAQARFLERLTAGEFPTHVRFVRTARPQDLLQMRQWLRENCKKDSYWVDTIVVHFVRDEDAVQFRMKFNDMCSAE